jgi:hypothetical protein
MVAPGPVQPAYLDLKQLARYASSSTRWLRARLVDQVHPLPHYRVEGKLLVKREEFDAWITQYRVSRPTDDLSQIVESVVAQVRPPRRAA